MGETPQLFFLRYTMKRMDYIVVAMLLLTGLTSADTTVNIGVIAEDNVQMEETVTAQKIESTHNFNADDVDVYFNGISLEEYTPEKEIRVESNTDAALGAFSRALKVMAEYRAGERTSVNHLEAKMLKYFVKITDAEIKTFHTEVTAKDLQALREWLQMNTNQIAVNIDAIAENRQAIQKNHQEAVDALNSLGYQVEAQDLALKKMDKDRYCNALVEVMKEHGFKRVKCDVNSRHCYNGDEFPFEDGRDYCLDIDDQERPPKCYGESNCGDIRSISVVTSVDGDLRLEAVFYNNHPTDDRDVKGRIEIFSEDGSIIDICKDIPMGVVKPGQRNAVSGSCIPEGLDEDGMYDVRLSVGAAGKEILVDSKIVYEDWHLDEVEGEIKPVLLAEIEESNEPPQVVGAAVAQPTTITSLVFGQVFLISLFSSLLGGYVATRLVKHNL